MKSGAFIASIVWTFARTSPSATSAIPNGWQNIRSSQPLYTTWTTPARTLQGAVDAPAPLQEIVVTNGTYITDGRAVGLALLPMTAARGKQQEEW